MTPQKANRRSQQPAWIHAIFRIVPHALAQNLWQLERLDLSVLHRSFFPEWGLHGLPVKPERSRVDPLTELPPKPERKGPPPPTEEQLVDIVEFLAPGDKALQGGIRQE